MRHKLTNKFIMSATISAVLLTACGVKSELKTPPPLWNKKKIDTHSPKSPETPKSSETPDSSKDQKSSDDQGDSESQDFSEKSSNPVGQHSIAELKPMNSRLQTP